MTTDWNTVPVEITGEPGEAGLEALREALERFALGTVSEEGAALSVPQGVTTWTSQTFS